MPSFVRITRHIYKLNLEWDLRIPFYAPVPVAVWLVDEGRQWTLIDAGAPGAESIAPEAVAAQIGDAPLGRLILTHGHPDHLAALPNLLDRWPVLPVWAHADEIPFIEGKRRYRDLPSRNWVFNLAKARLQEAAPYRRGVGALQPGTRVAGMTVVHAPGHTPGQIALFHRADRAVLCADAFMNLGGKLAPPLRMSTSDLKAARATMHKLAALDFERLLPSHDPGHGVTKEEVLQMLPRPA